MFDDPNRARTNFQEIEKFVSEDKILIAWDPDNNQIVGSVMCDTSDSSGPALMGMLAVDMSLAKKGYGTMLVEACETRAKSLGFSVL